MYDAGGALGVAAGGVPRQAAGHEGSPRARKAPGARAGRPGLTPSVSLSHCLIAAVARPPCLACLRDNRQRTMGSKHVSVLAHWLRTQRGWGGMRGDGSDGDRGWRWGTRGESCEVGRGRDCLRCLGASALMEAAGALTRDMPNGMAGEGRHGGGHASCHGGGHQSSAGGRGQARQVACTSDGGGQAPLKGSIACMVAMVWCHRCMWVWATAVVKKP